MTALLVIMATLTGCNSKTFDEARMDFTGELRARGTNPFIEAPVLKDLERRIRAIAMAKTAWNPNDFGPRNQAILANFQGQYDHAEMMLLINLSRQGFMTAASTLYQVSGSDSGCEINENEDFVFPHRPGKAVIKSWILTEGDCKDGKAHGVARAQSANGDAHFVGLFHNGSMIEGVYESATDDGGRVINIGDVPTDKIIGRLLTSYYKGKNGTHRYADFSSGGVIEGFGIVTFSFPTRMIVRGIGHYSDSKLHGFSARQSLKNFNGSKIWNTWLGTYQDDKPQGLAAWTNGVDKISLGEWTNGSRDGVQYEQYASVNTDFHRFTVGNFRKGKRHGVSRDKQANSFNDAYYVTEKWSNGKLVDTSDKPALNMGQIFALAAGAAVISSSDISSAAQIQIGSALAADVIGNTGGTNLASLQSSFANHARSTSAGTSSQSSGALSNTSGGNGITVDQVTITCPQSGVSNTIPVPYRTAICRRAAVDFATTYACNKLDQERVARNCKAACGNAQCLQN